MHYGIKIKDFDASLWFIPREGFNVCYYGPIRNGKTYTATADILKLLARGEKVVVNWDIDFTGHDERNDFWALFYKTIFGVSTFYKFDKSNLEYIDPARFTDPDEKKRNELFDYIARLVGVHLFLDEGQEIFNSHSKNYDPLKSRLILQGGHHCRTLNIITQRAKNVNPEIRGQVNIWYKCEKKMSWPFLVFQKTMIENTLADDSPAENEEGLPTEVYFASKMVYNAYNTHSRRSPDAIELPPSVEAYKLNLGHKLLSLVLALPLVRRFRRNQEQGESKT